MLVLSRKKEETIVLTGGIVLTVLEIRGGDKVRIGVEAPPEIQVLRGELVEHDEGGAP